MTNIYRKIYEEQYGPIPKDENGRTYEIHHIDGNHENNDINNLLCVSIKEHYDIHYSQRDYAACLRMAHRMKISPELKSELSKRNAQKQIINGIHPFMQEKFKKINRQRMIQRVKSGTHHLLSGDIQRKAQNELVKNNIHNFVGKHLGKGKKKSIESIIKRIVSRRKNGNYGGTKWYNNGVKNILRQTKPIGMNWTEGMLPIDKNKHSSKIIRTCPHCNLTGKGNSMIRSHFDNCIFSPNYIPKVRKYKQKVICPHCNKIGAGSNMKRYHFNNCKKNKE